MTADDTAPATVTMPADTLARIIVLLAELDPFLRSDSHIADQLTRYLCRHGSIHAGFDARNLIDEVSFAVAHLTGLTATVIRGDLPTGQRPSRQSREQP